MCQWIPEFFPLSLIANFQHPLNKDFFIECNNSKSSDPSPNRLETVPSSEEEPAEGQDPNSGAPSRENTSKKPDPRRRREMWVAERHPSKSSSSWWCLHCHSWRERKARHSASFIGTGIGEVDHINI
ncbi:hypothetical protein Anas_09700 [Armadillidium nasatum]|uniref:Uncharacterized protein n=1 Tax=Armadillidium nasatum TaxID=96803 RepID=A0A5N5SL58_9CRUS|nr:hypothetical protein Anas_09700 [Armadillidium nasatum]